MMIKRVETENLDKEQKHTEAKEINRPQNCLDFIKLGSRDVIYGANAIGQTVGEKEIKKYLNVVEKVGTWGNTGSDNMRRRRTMKVLESESRLNKAKVLPENGSGSY